MANEKRLIDANALVEFLKEQREKETGAYSKGRNNGINVAIGAIRNEQICPTVDAVEVVRCKDCKEWGGVSYGGRCKRWGTPLYGITFFTGADDFCSYGERREDNVE